MNTIPQTSSSTHSSLINHHPDANMLVEYASGSLPWGLSIAVAAHIQLCPKCRQEHSNLCVLGGSYLNQSTKEPVDANAFSRLLSNIGELNSYNSDSNNNLSKTPHQGRAEKSVKPNTTSLNQAVINAKKAGVNAEHLPKVVKKLLPPRLRWQKLSSALKSARLLTGQNIHEVAFHKISKGGKVVEHDHRGLEVTLVLEGSFSDEEGIYSPGDFIVKEPGQAHRPTASQNQDCLCLSVCEAPVKVTGLLGKMINPFLRIRPA